MEDKYEIEKIHTDVVSNNDPNRDTARISTN